MGTIGNEEEITYSAGPNIPTILSKIRDLESNWDGQGAEKVPGSVICKAEKIIARTANLFFDPEIFPTYDGGITISWGGVLATLDIRQDWIALHCGYKNILPSEVEQIISDDFNEELLSKKIKQWIKAHCEHTVQLDNTSNILII